MEVYAPQSLLFISFLQVEEKKTVMLKLEASDNE